MSHFTITVSQSGMARVRYSGIFRHSLDAVMDALKRFGLASKIVVRPT